MITKDEHLLSWVPSMLAQGRHHLCKDNANAALSEDLASEHQIQVCLLGECLDKLCKSTQQVCVQY